jgi:hypothetical protein
VRPGFVAATAILVVSVSISTWLAAAEYVARPLRGDFEPHEPHALVLTGADAKARRADMLRRATFTLPPDFSLHEPATPDPLRAVVPSCRFVPTELSGTTPKFDCVFAGGDVIKVKYGHDAEIHSEAASTALLRLLGYAADNVTIIPRVRCYGCPRHPFVAMHLRRTFHLPFVREQIDNGYTDFEWVSVERKFSAVAIETEMIAGWEWRELDRSGAPRDEVDAFRLLAAFLAHWDNKSQNQRLVCLDPIRLKADTPLAARESVCERPLAMIQDAGASFGPLKVNLARWRDLPVWYDRTRCLLSMRALPFEGATFEDVQITEGGRALLASRLSAISDAQIERLFADAHFPQFQAGTDDERDLRAWTRAFRSRVRQIAAARCPGENSELPNPASRSVW